MYGPFYISGKEALRSITDATTWSKLQREMFNNAISVAANNSIIILCTGIGFSSWPSHAPELLNMLLQIEWFSGVRHRSSQNISSHFRY